MRLADDGAAAEHRHLPVAISDHVTYLPRGTRLRLGGTAFGFLGGAFSVDWRDRVLGRDWWPNEAINSSDVDRLGPGPLDVLSTHDAPAGINLSSPWRLPADDQIRADDVRAVIDRAVTTTTPRIVIHGHWHHGHDTEMTWIDRAETERTGDLSWGSTRVVGLGRDGNIKHGWTVPTYQHSTSTGPTTARPPDNPRLRCRRPTEISTRKAHGLGDSGQKASAGVDTSLVSEVSTSAEDCTAGIGRFVNINCRRRSFFSRCTCSPLGHRARLLVECRHEHRFSVTRARARSAARGRH